MGKLVSLKELNPSVKLELLKKLGYDCKDNYVTFEGNRVIDKYVDKPVKVDNMLILHGSTVILDDNPISIASYLEEYGDF